MDTLKEFRFDHFTVVADRRRLLVHGELVKVSARAFDLLIALITRADRPVAKAELLDVVWPDVEVEEGNLHVHVSTLRKLLGAEAILTVPGRGYQFSGHRLDDERDNNLVENSTGRISVSPSIANGGQNRHQTVMSVELIGFFGQTTRLEVEDLRDIIAICYQCCAQTIEQYGGYVAHVAGDGLLAFFGYPQANESDAENSVQAAFGLKTLTEQLGSQYTTPLQTCIGIATGVLAIAEPKANMEPSAFGEAITLSSRLQTLAKPGQILIAHSTLSLLGRLFEYRNLGPVTLKGLVHPLEIFEVCAPSNLESRFEAYRAAKPTPMVGRQEELDVLLRRWQRARNGESSVVIVSGEPGIGKSRLAHAALEAFDHDRNTVTRLFCSPQQRDSPLYPFISHLERASGFIPLDTAEQRLAKLAMAVIGDTRKSDKILPVLADLLSISIEGDERLKELTPQQRKEDTFEALIALIHNSRKANPAVLMVEDLHWIDPTSLELLDHLMERASNKPLMIILTARPEFISPWSGRSHTTLITIERLRPRESAEIISRVASGRRLTNTVVTRILDRADGIPLFIEELTKAVIENGVLTDIDSSHQAINPIAPEIPRTLHSSLLARLDRIPSAREVAQLGSALGRRFSYRLISAVAVVPQQQLNDALTQLVEAQLIWCRGKPPDAEYTFKHALVQDAAYSTLRRETRHALHARIAETIEQQFPEMGEAQPDLLAHHFTEAQVVEKAARLWGKAGELSLARSAFKESAIQLERAIGLLDTLESSTDITRNRIKMQIALANALMHAKGYAAPETKVALDRARGLVKEAEASGELLDDPLPFLSVLHGFWVANHVAFEGDAVRDLSAEFMALAEKQETVFPLVLGHRIMGTSLLFLGDITGGRAHLDSAISLYDPEEHRKLATRFGHDAGVAVLSNRPLALWLLGYADAAMLDADKALEYAKALGQRGSFLYALTRIAWIHQVMGNLAKAEGQTRELMALSEDMDGSYWKAAGILLRGCQLALTGDGASAIAAITSGIAASRAKGANLLRMPWYLSCLARAHIAVGKIGKAQQCLDQAMKAMSTTQERWQESDLHRMNAELALMSSKKTNACEHYKRAIAVARRQDAKHWELRAAIGLARLLRDQGKRRSAYQTIFPVCSLFTEGFATPDFEEAQSLIAELA